MGGWRGGRHFLMGVVLGLLAALPAVAQERVTLQLRGTHQFQGAGYYAAIARGYYREAGLEVTLLEGGAERDPAAAVLEGRAQFGIGTAALLQDFAAGRPVIVVAPLLQHSPFVLLARRGADLRGPRDLAGRGLALEAHAAECIVFLARAGLKPQDMQLLPYPDSARRLGQGGLDAMTASATDAPFDLIEAGQPYQLWNPREAGIDFYGDTLFVHADFARARPDLVRALRDATLRGWAWALDNPEAAIALILADHAPGANRRKLEFEAGATRRLMLPEIVALGSSNPARWQGIAEAMAGAGLLPAGLDLDGLVFEAAAPHPGPWAYAAIAGLSLLLLAALLLARRFWGLSRALQGEVTRGVALRGQLAELARTDPLTGLTNRRSFLEAAERARRGGQVFSLVAFDLDHFKAINDQHGHAAGDAMLRHFAALCRQNLREGDLAGRLGGEEFSLLLLADEAAAVAVARRIAGLLAASPVAVGGRLVQGTVSAGVFFCAGTAMPLQQALAEADARLHAAKRGGRNRVQGSAGLFAPGG
ncbi:GGDEF domain-containing protein [Roseomonas sp. 18066]|uniref:GGDEF domain-containing protein n=1 Tax=Roseomonas sp. 18066 TaxID=2681412 RepID=UPI00135A139E|nr:GGDEF domain-containing protein [Roseomonas sp. 18066]